MDIENQIFVKSDQAEKLSKAVYDNNKDDLDTLGEWYAQVVKSATSYYSTFVLHLEVLLYTHSYALLLIKGSKYCKSDPIW